MTTNDALQTIFECADYDQDENVAREWERAMVHITNQLGVVFDEETQQWVSAYTGNVI